MALPTYALQSIVAILEASANLGGPFRVLGTGFFIDEDGQFLTANHVIGDEALDEGRSYALARLPDLPTMHRVTSVKPYVHVDVAVGEAPSAAPSSFLEVADDDAPLNFDVLTAEFSSVEYGVLAGGKRAIDLTPNYHKGHVVSSRSSRLPSLNGAQVLELSFPALKGASGAPIVVGEGDKAGQVIGMILANVERHLLPAQIETITSEDGQSAESRYYYLPRAYALSWRHLLEIVRSNGREVSTGPQMDT